VHNVSQWPNLRHLAEALGAAVGLLEAASFKETTESFIKKDALLFFHNSPK